jgi:hypothetical protein
MNLVEDGRKARAAVEAEVFAVAENDETARALAQGFFEHGQGAILVA